MSRNPQPSQPDPEIVGDVLRSDLRVVFCGTALGAASARARAYYAGPGNKFWPTLHAVGLTPELLAPSDYRRILDYGLGLTDLCKTRSGSDLEIGNDGFDVARLAAQMERYRPARLAFNGKKAAKEALGVGAVDYGLQRTSFAGIPTFVLPSTSGAAGGNWDVEHWRALAKLVRWSG